MIAYRQKFKGLIVRDVIGNQITRSHSLNVFALHKKKTGLTPCRVRLKELEGGEGQLLAIYSDGANITVDFQSYEVMQEYVRRKHWDIEELVEIKLEESVPEMTEPKVYYTTRPLSERPDDLIYDFTDKETIAELEVTIKKQLTPYDIENIIVTAFEGGINYWADAPPKNMDGDNINELLGGKPKRMPFSQWTTHLLLNGQHIVLADNEDYNEKYKLDLEAVKKGYAIMVEKHSMDLETFDAGDADNLIQYGLFGKQVYG